VDLGVGQAGVLGEQQGQHVAVIDARLAVAIDELPGELPHAAPSPVETDVVWGGNPVQRGYRQHHSAGHSREDGVDASLDLGDLGRARPSREQRPGHDAHGEFVHRCGNVDDLTVPPRFDGGGYSLGHHGRVTGQPLPVEGGLEESAPLAVLPVRTRAQPVADDRPERVDERATLVEGPVVRQHPMDQVRVADHVGRPRSEPDLDDVAMGGQRCQESQGRTAERERVPQHRQRTGSGSRAERGGHGRTPIQVRSLSNVEYQLRSSDPLSDT
jgi:hypothetical protein